MLDLKKEWEKLDKDKFSGEINKSLETVPEFSSMPLEKLKSHLKLGIIYVSIFIPVYLILLFTFEGLLLKTCLVVVLLSLIWAFVTYRKLYLELSSSTPDINKGMKEMLRSLHLKISSTLKKQEKLQLIIYPFSILGGVLLGLTYLEKMDIYLSTSKDWIILALIILMLSPIFYWISKLLNQRIFGAYLHQLEIEIDEFDA
jgi:hypothetical protein